MRKPRLVIITVIITVVVVFVIGAVIKSTTESAEEGAEVRIEQPQRGELVESVSAPGQIEPKTKVAISAKISARIMELPYDEGDTVSGPKPQATPPVPASVLVRLDAKDLESQLRSVQAAHASQVAQLEVEKANIASQRASLHGLGEALKQAKRDMGRKKGLYESQDISLSTFDSAQCKVDEQKARYEAAKHSLLAAELALVVLKHNLEAADARVAQAQEALSYTTITSPIDGVVTRLNAEVGELVMTGTMNNPGTVIVAVADLSQMLLVAEVDEADVGKLKVGQLATVYVQPFSDDEFKGVVDSIALTHSFSSSGTKCFRTEILLETNEKQLYSGLTAHVDIQTHKHTDVLKLPSQAVLGRPVDDLPLEIRENSPQVDKNKTYATVVYRYVDDKAVVTPVETGPSDMTHTIILSGISDDDKIIVGPYKVLESLAHEQKVRDEREPKSKVDKDGEKDKTIEDNINTADNTDTDQED